MKYKFKAIADYEQRINERLEKLCSRFSKFPETVVKIETKPSSSGFLWYEIEILTPEVKFNGYSHVATIKLEVIKDEDKTETINIVFPSNRFQDEDFSRYFEVNFRCDHCHTNRYRTIAHIFRNEAGEDLMIASSCARSYFGERVYKLLGLYELLSPLIIAADLDDIFGDCCGGRYREGFNTLDYCVYAYGIMKKYNTFVSQKKKDEWEMCGRFVESTKDKTDFLFHKHEYLSEGERQALIEERKECRELAKDFSITAVKEYWFNKYSDNKTDNFMRSCFLNLSLISPKPGLLIYAVSAYMREIEGAFSSNVGSEDSQFIGNVGERLKGIEATITFSSIRETQYGLSTTIKFLDTKGNILVWFASGGIDVEMNKKISLTGTVKKHDEYKGKKQTILNRCKIAK